jgi:uncharacterized protein YraI
MRFAKASKLLGIATGSLLAGIIAAAAQQTPVTATTDLNVRSGPGSQYPVVGVIGAGQSTTISGCIEKAKWCAINEGDGTGYVYADYLTADIGGSQTIITDRYADAHIVYVDPPAEGSIAVIDGATGSIDDELIGRVEDVAAVEPPDTVRTYVTSNRVDPVYLDGEVVVGAGLPERVVLSDIPDYDYQYVYVNGQPALVEPSSRRIVYVYR